MLNKQILGPTLSGCATNFQYVKRPWLAYYNIEMSDMYASFTPLNSPVQITRVVSTISILKVRKLLPRKWHNSPLLKGQLMAELFPLCWVSLSPGQKSGESIWPLAKQLASGFSFSTSYFSNSRQTLLKGVVSPCPSLWGISQRTLKAPSAMNISWI